MKIRIRQTPNNYWVVEKKFLFWWLKLEEFYEWNPNGDGAQKSAFKYAQILINPKIIEVKDAKKASLT